jgi:uncharacterized protein
LFMSEPFFMGRPPSTLAVVGASVRAAAASAVHAGLKAVAADLFADLDLQRVARATRIGRYPKGLLAWLKAMEPKPDAWMYGGALENHPDLVDAMAQLCPLLGRRRVSSFPKRGGLPRACRGTAHGW